MKHQLKSHKKLGRKEKDVKVYSLKSMIPKKYRETHNISAQGDKVYLERKEKNEK